MRFLLSFAITLVMFTGCALSTLTLSNTLGDNMVLPRTPLSATIWGTSEPSLAVYLTIEAQSKSTTADINGTWSISLDPASPGGPYTLTVTNTNGEKINVQNVMFGDLFLCGGQSNMQFTVASGYNASEEIADAANYPNIRLFTVGQSTSSTTPLDELATIEQPWTVASSASVGLGNWSAFSAVCWFTGKYLFDTYGVPIGLISDNWGGTMIQAWSDEYTLDGCDAVNSWNANSILYNAMIVPYLPQSITAFIWYQGEQNAGANQATLYACMFPAMITNWRNAFANQADTPFFFVQLSTWVADGTTIPDTRQAQLAALTLPNVGYATAVDLGDALSPQGNIHPRDKQDVGKRLTYAMQNILYGENVIWQGPTFSSVVSNSDPNGDTTFTLSLNLNGDSGITIKDGVECPQGIPVDLCKTFEVELTNGTWVDASTYTIAPIVNGLAQVLITAEATGEPFSGSIRYAYSAWPLCTLYSQTQDLPTIPFQYIATA